MMLYIAVGNKSEKIYAMGNTYQSMRRRLQHRYSERKYIDAYRQPSYYPESLRFERRALS